MSEALLSSSDRNKIINNLMGIEYAALKPAEKLALDIHNTNIALKKALDHKGISAENVDPWEHKSTGMRCATCMWCVEKKSAAGLSLPEGVKYRGRCRRHAPTMSGYPVIFMDDWCGDHKLA